MAGPLSPTLLSPRGGLSARRASIVPVTAIQMVGVPQESAEHKFDVCTAILSYAFTYILNLTYTYGICT